MHPPVIKLYLMCIYCCIQAGAKFRLHLFLWRYAIKKKLISLNNDKLLKIKYASSGFI